MVQRKVAETTKLGWMVGTWEQDNDVPGTQHVFAQSPNPPHSLVHNPDHVPIWAFLTAGRPGFRANRRLPNGWTGHHLQSTLVQLSRPSQAQILTMSPSPWAKTLGDKSQQLRWQLGRNSRSWTRKIVFFCDVNTVGDACLGILGKRGEPSRPCLEERGGVWTSGQRQEDTDAQKGRNTIEVLEGLSRLISGWAGEMLG